MDQRSKCKSYNCKTIKRKYREKLHGIGLGNNFLDMTAKASVRKYNIDKSDYIKI